MSSRPVKEVLGVAALLAVLFAGYVVLRGGDDEGSGRVVPVIPSVHAIDLHHSTVYHSPQKPGYTAWVGAWAMPDGSLMVGFVQATGPRDPAQRDRTPTAVAAAFGTDRPKADRDFWGLDQKVEYLRSYDGGDSWARVHADDFQAPTPYAYTQQATVALSDGTLLRRVNGDDLRQDDSFPHTAFLQRLTPSAQEWSAPQVLLDPAKYTYQISRIRKLRDGRLIATGNVWNVPAEGPADQRTSDASAFLLMVSSDEGRTWKNGMTIPKSIGYLPGNEWDTAELPDGDLVALMRTRDGPTTRHPVRKQAILRKRGGGWVMTRLRTAPFPPSGHPELLTTREGPILQIATTGISYTKDGETWTTLTFPGDTPYTSPYYPRAVQTSDGVIHVFGHIGLDDPFGARDQSIVSDTFRLQRDALPGTSTAATTGTTTTPAS